MLRICLFLVTILMQLSSPAFAQSGNHTAASGKCHFVVASRRTLNEVHEFGRKYALMYREAYLARNGWIAITFGEVDAERFEEIKANAVRRWGAPKDSYCSRGASYIQSVRVFTPKEYAQIINSERKPLITIDPNLAREAGKSLAILGGIAVMGKLAIDQLSRDGSSKAGVGTGAGGGTCLISIMRFAQGKYYCP